MAHKNDYSVVAFFSDNTSPKRWTYVHRLYGFSQFLNKKHPAWRYINVYDRRNGNFIKRFYREQFIPDFLLVLFFLTFSITDLHYTLLNGFNNTATIQIPC